MLRGLFPRCHGFDLLFLLSRVFPSPPPRFFHVIRLSAVTSCFCQLSSFCPHSDSIRYSVSVAGLATELILQVVLCSGSASSRPGSLSPGRCGCCGGAAFVMEASSWCFPVRVRWGLMSVIRQVPLPRRAAFCSSCLFGKVVRKPGHQRFFSRQSSAFVDTESVHISRNWTQSFVLGVVSKLKEGGQQEACSVTMGPKVLAADLMEAPEGKRYPAGSCV